MAINTDCKITNSSGKSVVVLNAFNSSTNVAQNSTKQGYLQELKALTGQSGATVLADGATDTITLNETYVDKNGATKPSYIYDLMFSQTDSLFPVMVVGQSLDFDSLSYPPITVTKAAADNMAKAYAFCQNIMTSPTSKMAVAFQAAMSDALRLKTVADIDKAIADFFNQYDTFKGLDFPSYVAVSTWLRGFAYIWGMADSAKLGQTYYVYSAPEAGKKGATSEGTIVFAQKANPPSPADPTDRQSGMTITLNPSDGSASTLTFVDGQVIDSEGGAVALNCSYGFKGTFTGKQTETTAWVVLTGKILNKSVIAIPLAPDSDNESGWSKFWSGLTFQKVLTYFLEAMGVWMALDFLKQKLVGKTKKLNDDQANENDGKEPDAQQENDADEASSEVGDSVASENQARIDSVDLSGEVKMPESDAEFSQSVSDARVVSSDALNGVAGDNIDGGLDSAKAQLDTLAEIENTPEIESAMGDLVDAKQKLNAGDLDGANQGLDSVNKQIPDITENMGDAVSAETKAEIADAVEVQEEASEVADESSDNADDAESGTEEPFEDGVVPEV
ncbi:hypothetical protein [Nannocystis punicea]|uniref:Uncharacterized protein n=1 Tax=Nannocystis punicea TaxID=2995304 RepID=A0ABY7GW35_9BACT|nr:hypothetical protein [Nannocystis poenicansa]WAS91142.1 hypothetical protein O0S08_33565 [Nannocystis poenicansa]